MIEYCFNLIIQLRGKDENAGNLLQSDRQHQISG